MARAIDLILFDLDGTLLDPARAIREANRAAIQAALDLGIRVGLATGRSPASARPYAESIGATGPLIVFNGAVIWDVDKRRPVHQTHLPRTDARHAIAIARTHGAHVNVYVGDEIWIDQRSPTSRHSERKDGVSHRVVGDVLARLDAESADVIKLMIIDERHSVTRLAAPIRAASVHACALVNSEPSYLEMLPPGVDKGAALAHIERIYGITAARVLAFGDQQNDLELLATAGVGVAMGNAIPALKAVADAVIGDNDTDAIAAFLRTRLAR